MCRCSNGQGTGRPASCREKNPGLAIRCCLVVLQAYQLIVSPLYPPCCRFTPTCSQYAQDAVRRYGVLRGLFLAAGRILRCHPFSRGGYDPVR